MPGLSTGKEVVRVADYLSDLDSNQSVAVVVGGYASGVDAFEEVEDHISISSFPLSAGVCCSKVTTALEDMWNVL